MNATVIELNEPNFDQEVMRAAEPVLVEFWAGWTDRCRAVAPLVESAAQGPPLPVKIAEVNVEDNQALAERYAVRAIPTLLIFKHGNLCDRVVGRRTERELREKLAQLAQRPGVL
jgi:thioredoxin